jgi:hypothetical protein
MTKWTELKPGQFALYQIHLTADEVETINRTGSHNSVPRHAAKLDIQCTPDKEKEQAVEKAWDAGFYTHVANITAENLEDVFKIGNIGPEENIERLAEMHSVSVGDVVIQAPDDKGNLDCMGRHVVASFGFQVFGYPSRGEEAWAEREHQALLHETGYDSDWSDDDRNGKNNYLR